MLALAARSESARAAPAPDTAAAVERRTPPEEAWRVADFDPTRYFRPAELRAWQEYGRSQRRVHLLGFALDLLFYLALVLSPLAPWLLARCTSWATGLGSRRPFARGPLERLGRIPARIFGPDWHAALLFAFVIFGLGTLLNLPLALWQEWLAQRAELSIYTVPAWTLDTLRSLALQLFLLGCLVFGLYGLIRRFPRRWWLALALPAALALVAYGFLEPSLPRLYHRVVPLEASKQLTPAARAELRTRLDRLLRARGLTLRSVKVIQTSRTSRAMNAYLVGLGRGRELVLYDTLLGEATAEELEAAVAHELGHEHARNDLVTYGLASLALTALLWLLAAVLHRGSRWMGLSGPGHVATLPLLGFTVWLVFALAQPVISWRARSLERRADRIGLALTGNPEAYIRLQVRLARRNRTELSPPAWVRWWLSGHPSVQERIGTAQWYARWLRRPR